MTWRVRLDMSLKDAGILLRALDSLEGQRSPAQEKVYRQFRFMLGDQHAAAGVRESEDLWFRNGD